MTGAQCRFCGRTFLNQQAVRAHLKACPSYRQLPKAAVPSTGSVPGTPRVRPSTPVPGFTREPVPDSERPRRPAPRPAPHAADGAVRQFLRRTAIQAVKTEVLDSWWSIRHPVPAEIKAEALAAIERELSRLPADELPRSELVTIASGIRDRIYAPVLAAQQRTREEEQRRQAHTLQRPLRIAVGALHARRWLGQHPDLDGRTRADLEHTVRQALDRGLDGSESDTDVKARMEEILGDALKHTQKTRRETARRALIAHGIEYATQELAQADTLSPWERASTGRDVKIALEDEITGTESEPDVEALVDDVLDDVLGEAEDDAEDDDESEDEDDDESEDEDDDDDDDESEYED
jgi:hypothetical protein